MSRPENNMAIVVVTLFMLIGARAQCESLFSELSYKPLATDHIASNIGDLLTVVVFESSTASTSAESDTTTTTDIDGSFRDNVNTVTAGASVANDFNGGGSVNREGKFVARVSAVVTERRNNGDLRIEGSQSIELNNEVQTIAIEGWVRPRDISSDNVVLSPRLADAEIRYVGEGLLTNKEKPGILTRFVDWLF